MLLTVNQPHLAMHQDRVQHTNHSVQMKRKGSPFLIPGHQVPWWAKWNTSQSLARRSHLPLWSPSLQLPSHPPSRSRAEEGRRGCLLRWRAGGGSRAHLIPVGPLAMQGQRGHAHPTGVIIVHRHGDAWRGLGREVVVVRYEEDAPGVTAVITEAGGGWGGGVVAQVITELPGHHVTTPLPLSPRGHRGAPP